MRRSATVDKRAVLFGIAALALVILLGRERILEIVTRAGGFSLVEGGEQTIELPDVEIPTLPGFKSGPSAWVQTTGLMCDCDDSDYSGPVVVQNITVPQIPGPRYVYQLPTSVASATVETRTYREYGMDSTTLVWGDRPNETVWGGSDGRIFLKPKGLFGTQPNTSNSPHFIGTNEYRMEGGKIYYGSLVYEPPLWRFA